jgi:hypothetical protein
MNCQSFETIIHELASGKLIDEATNHSGLLHAEECAECEAKLLDERQLSQALSALAAEDNKMTAPASLDGILMAEFRARTVRTEGVADITVLGQVAVRKRYHWSLAVAAAVLAAVSVVLVMKASAVRNSASLNQNKAPSVDVTSDPSTAIEEPNGSDDQIASTVADLAPAPSKSTAQRNLPPRTTIHSVANKNIPVMPKDVADTAGADAQEIATDFLPVSYTSNLTPVESGHLVRVELPMAALASYGLPMSMSEPSGRVKADVLLDEYGTARAIRFVR